MSYKNINVDELIESVQKSLEEDKAISSGLKSLINLLVFLVTSLLQSKKTNSKNSSTPPSQDPYRKKEEKEGSGKTRGGQKGRVGTTLMPVEKPDEEVFLALDKNSLPLYHIYTEDLPEKRQVFDLVIERRVTQYSAQVWKDENGKRYTATFPAGVKNHAQYGESVKAHAVYLYQYQLLPVQRITEYFSDKLNLHISDGSVINWTHKASEKLTELKFLELLKENLQESEFLHLDETGMNIAGKREWLHVASNDKWTYLFPHKKR
jgi:transposase